MTTGRRKPGLTAATAAVIGRDIGVAVPVQRHPPKFVISAGVAEILALALFFLSASLAAFVALILAAALLVGLAATNRRQVVAITATEAVIVAATLRGRPLAPTSETMPSVAWPPPRGLGAPVTLNGRTWWVDRTAFARLRRARELAARVSPPRG